MTAKRIFLGLLTLVAAASVVLSLFESWNQPQFQSRLELYETDLLLQASQWKGAEEHYKQRLEEDKNEQGS